MQVVSNQYKYSMPIVLKNKNTSTHKVETNTVEKEKINTYFYPIFTGKIKKPVLTKLERFKGCLLGGAIGDALGAKVEFLSTKDITKIYGEGGLAFKKIINGEDISKITDDTQMTFYTADGIIKSAIKNNSINNIDFGCIYQSYLDWLQAQSSIPNYNNGWINKIPSMKDVMSPGNTCVDALISRNPGTLSNQINDSKGNGGVMRVAPVGLVYHNNPHLAFDIGIGTAALTHSDPDAYLSAGMLASIIAFLINGKNLSEAIESSIQILKTKEYNESVAEIVEDAIFFSKNNITPKEAFSRMGTGKIGSEALAMALYSCLISGDNIEKALELSVNYSQDRDTVAAITGNIIGTIIGFNNIPKGINKLKDSSAIISLSNDLYLLLQNKIDKNKYPIDENQNSIKLKRMLKTNNHDVKQKNDKLIIKMKKLDDAKIDDFYNYMLEKDISKNIIEEIGLPLELIEKEVDSKYFYKFSRSLLNNVDKLIEEENEKCIWSEDRSSISDLLWVIYEISLNKNNVNEFLEIATIMIESNNYSLTNIIEHLKQNFHSKKSILKKLEEDLYFIPSSF